MAKFKMSFKRTQYFNVIIESDNIEDALKIGINKTKDEDLQKEYHIDHDFSLVEVDQE